MNPIRQNSHLDVTGRDDAGGVQDGCSPRTPNLTGQYSEMRRKQDSGFPGGNQDPWPESNLVAFDGSPSSYCRYKIFNSPDDTEAD